jgi:glutaredoxin
MKKTSLFLPLAAAFLLLCAGSASAQMFKWVDEKGVTHFSDTPPPDKKGKTVNVKSFSGTEGGTPLPYELAQSARNHPVTLYTSTSCAPCDAGRTLLQKRGIPFSEKTVSTPEDLAKLQAVGGSATLPLLMVGPVKLPGFQEEGWNSALNNADYPATSRLPRGYRNSTAAAAPPPPKPSAAEIAAKAEEAAAAKREEQRKNEAVQPRPAFTF